MQNLICIILFVTAVYSLSCNNKEPVLPGRLDRVSDAVMVDCHAYKNSTELHSCIVFANPRTKQWNVFDGSDNQYLLNEAYLPLPVSVGSYTNMLAVHEELPYVFGLDGIDDKIFITPTTNASDGIESFSKPTTVDTDAKPYAIAIDNRNGNARALITIPSANALQVIEFDEKMQKKSSYITPANGTPMSIKIDAYKKFAVMSDGEGTNINVIELDTLVDGATPTNTPIDAGGPTTRVAVGTTMAFGGDRATSLAMVLRPDTREIIFINLDGAPAKIMSPLFLKDNDVPLVPFIPTAPHATCCNGEKNWAAVTTANGKHYYIKLIVTNGVLVPVISESDTVDLTKKDSQSASVGLASAIVSGAIRQSTSANTVRSVAERCERKTFYTFETNYVLVSCEGQGAKSTQIDSLQ